MQFRCGGARGEPREDPPSSSRGDFPAGPPREFELALQRVGIRPSLTYLAEPLANVAGGMRRGAVYEGRLDLGIDADLNRLMGWSGAKFHANMFHIHGDALSRQYIGNLMLVSGMEAFNHARLYELWIEQAFGDRFSLRFGQLAADVEFFYSKYAEIFVQSTLGWPVITGVNLPAGGPAPPMSSVGIRAKAQLSDRVTLLLGMYDGNAAGRGDGEAQHRNPHGLNFRVTDPPLLLGELQYAYALGPARPGTLKLGAWVHADRFDDMRYTAEGLSLADPAGSGMPAQRRGNVGPYAVIEQMLVPADPKGETGVAAFARINAAPADRNLISFYVDGGLNVSGFWRARPNDKFAIGAAYARISPAARGLDQDALRFGTPTAVRDYEAAIEVNYQAELRRGYTVQPVVQYLINPGGGAANPFAPTAGKRIPNATMIGLRIMAKLGQRDPDSQQ